MPILAPHIAPIHIAIVIRKALIDTSETTS
jgi:hypothetical protein